MFHIWNNTMALPRKKTKQKHETCQTVYVKGLCGGIWMRRSKFTDWWVCCSDLPSVKLHLSQPEEGGVLHGDTPSSASIKKIDTHKP